MVERIHVLIHYYNFFHSYGNGNIMIGFSNGFFVVISTHKDEHGQVSASFMLCWVHIQCTYVHTVLLRNIVFAFVGTSINEIACTCTYMFITVTHCIHISIIQCAYMCDVHIIHMHIVQTLCIKGLIGPRQQSSVYRITFMYMYVCWALSGVFSGVCIYMYIYV